MLPIPNLPENILVPDDLEEGKDNLFSWKPVSMKTNEKGSTRDRKLTADYYVLRNDIHYHLKKHFRIVKVISVDIMQLSH